VATYRKIHLFDNDVPGAAYRESSTVAAGDEVVTGAVDDLELGLSVCYDLRFPELYRALVDRGAQAVTVPAAFMARTGVDHWEPLLRARAIENQVFVVAAGQIGAVTPAQPLHGHSMIIDPWGTPIATASDGAGVVVADLDLDHLAEVRRRMPSLEHRRPGLA
jgi:predicted amidohydrolase